MDKLYLVRFDILRYKRYHARYRFVTAKSAKEARTQFDTDWGSVRHGNVPYPYHLTVKLIRPDDEKTMALPGRPLVANVTVSRVERHSPVFREPMTDTKQCVFIMRLIERRIDLRMEHDSCVRLFNPLSCYAPFTRAEMEEFISDNLHWFKDTQMTVSGFDIKWEV